MAGIDEVGRGCFAGSVVAGCVVFKNKTAVEQLNNETIVINDSKKLTSLQRERANKWIKQKAIIWGIGEVSAGVINRIGMTKATQMAFRRAVNNTNRKLENRSKNRIQFLLIDHFFAPYIRGLPMVRKQARRNRNLKDSRSRQKAIVNGDEKSLSIAAASIIAKVYRDKEMISLNKKSRYKKYGWDRNKGYGTREHRKAIKREGITKYHRRQFVETFLSKPN